MNKGLLIYNPEDFEKNKWFVGQLLQKAKEYGLALDFILRNQLVLSINEEGQFSASGRLCASNTQQEICCRPFSTQSSASDVRQTEGLTSALTNQTSVHLNPLTSFENLDFVINRTRDSVISIHFEKMGCRVFNSSTVTEICNHKGKTHQLVNSQAIPSVPTLLCHKYYFTPTLVPFPYPLIIKSVSGHGGSEVFKADDETALITALKKLPSDEFILQSLCSNPGTDIRVFTLGKDIVAAVKRFCPTSFKSNYSLGGSAAAYTLNPEEKALVSRILNLLDFDFVGIDFILDKDNNLLFNEIEDVVGTRTLYLNYADIDIVESFLSYISRKLR